MSKNLLQIIFLSCVLSLGLIQTSCKKDPVEPAPEEPAAQTGTVKVGFVNMVDSLPLVFNQKYINANGDTFKVNIFNYFISSIVFTKSDNSTFSEPASHHLIKHASSTSTLVSVANVPAGEYKSISFIIGVDSASNVSGAQAGDLSTSVAGDMFWSWSTGYIMFKLEGTAPNSGAANKSIVYHIGVYGGAYKSQRNFVINTGPFTVAPGNAPQINLKVNLNEFFKSPNTINVATNYFQMSANASAKMYADNYADMISFLSKQ